MEWKLIRKDKTKEYYYCSNKSIYKCKATMKKLIESNLEQKTGHSRECLRSRRINRTNSQKNISLNKEQENVLLKEKLELMEKLLKREKDFEEIHKDILDLKNKFEERNYVL